MTTETEKLLPYQSENALRHGHARHNGPKASPTYQSWLNMKTRCRRKYQGISVCTRWMLFENFLSDMGERPAGMTLDRINNMRGYEPGNCRWATNTEQARNRRNSRLEYMDAFTICCRMLSGYTARSIAEEFQCSESLPREILRGCSWKDASKAAHEFMGAQK